MRKEMIMLLNEFKEPIIGFLESANKTSFLDYFPHLISAFSVLIGMIIVIIQHKQAIALQQKAEIFKTKKEAILEALAFLDTYVSWLDIDNCCVLPREETNDVHLTILARAIHNKLCVSCNNPEIIKLFVDIVIPSETEKEGYPVFKKYNEFRNACRVELGYTAVDLPADKIYLAKVSTKALQDQKSNNV